MSKKNQYEILQHMTEDHREEGEAILHEAGLTEQEAEIIRLNCFGQDEQTLEVIAEKLFYSTRHTTRLRASAITKLCRYLQVDSLPGLRRRGRNPHKSCHVLTGASAI